MPSHSGSHILRLSGLVPAASQPKCLAEDEAGHTQPAIGRSEMSYYFSKTLDVPLSQAVEKIIDALKSRGFGILTRIDVQSVLKEKIGADFHPYVILGACNPKMAHQALQAEDKIGTMLPCNVIVQEVGGKTEVAAVDPVASMQAIQNPGLEAIAVKVREDLKAAVQAI
jgi:uncharacterized protein (DUF302 family)